MVNASLVPSGDQRGQPTPPSAVGGIAIRRASPLGVPFASRPTISNHSNSGPTYEGFGPNVWPAGTGAGVGVIVVESRTR
jgi:hypothetical protein